MPKRPPPCGVNGEDPALVPAEAEKRARTEPAVLPDLPAPEAPAIRVTAVLEEIAAILRTRPFGLRSTQHDWATRRRLYAILPSVIAVAARGGEDVSRAAAEVVQRALCSGYAQTALDRQELVAMGAWRPCVAVLEENSTASAACRVEAVHLYVQLAEHVNYYDDFSNTHPDFWCPELFARVLHHMPAALLQIPDSIEAEQWEMICVDLEAALKCIGSFLLFWTSAREPQAAKLNAVIPQIMPLLVSVVETLAKFDARHGAQISAKNRGDPLEELTRLAGVLTQLVVEQFEAEEGRRSTAGLAAARERAGSLLGLLVHILSLRIPTCAPKTDSLGGGPFPVEERQQDTEWIQNLCDRLEGECPIQAATLSSLFSAMAEMPMEEQRYRLECISLLIPPFIARHAAQLKQKTVPAELADLKQVLNAVLQDDPTVAAELLEEISFYPCLLDFTTKRATLQGICERLKLQAGAGDPIRLVVPRDNVLDGVCDSLNLQDQSARIEVPLEIEFRAGYADETGNELVDEGEDQGGLRRQWLDRASRYFVGSDLFMTPEEDAAHLSKSAPSSPRTGSKRTRGRIVVPSPEPVCSCVQDDWEMQFELFGCILGFAILYKETMPVHFGHNFLRAVFGIKTDAEDLLPLLESVDTTLHTKLKYILDGGYLQLGDTLADALDQSNLPRVFAVKESHIQELVKTTLLKEGGDGIEVTEENKEEFVKLLLDRVLVSGVARQVDCFRRGLLRVVPDELVQRVAELMAVKEIELLVCGADEIDVSDWEKHTQYENGYTKDSQPVIWFWEAVRGLSEGQRAQLLSFATGSTQVPSGGFRFLQPELFTIQRVRVTDRYPEAHTCANTLDLPEYESKEELELKLRFSIEETGDAFGRR